MTLRPLQARVRMMADALREMHRPPALNLIVAIPYGCDNAESREPGTYLNGTGTTAEVVYAGDGPDPDRLAQLETRLATDGLIIVTHR